MSEISQVEEVVTNALIRCAHTSIMSPKDLHPHPKNPNTHPTKQIEMFISILDFQGWRRCITVSTRSQFVTKGHGALLAALTAGYTEVPVDYQDYDSEEQELADIVADNQLARMSEMDTGKLQAILVPLNTNKMNMEMTGFEIGKLDKLLGIKKTPNLSLKTEAGEQLVGAPAEPGSEYVPLPTDDDQSESPYTSDGNRVASNQVRMIQLFFAEEGLSEFMQLTDFFAKEFNIDNTTDTVLEVLRRAKNGFDEASS